MQKSVRFGMAPAIACLSIAAHQLSRAAEYSLFYDIASASTGQSQLQPNYVADSQFFIPASPLTPSGLSVNAFSDQQGVGKWYWAGWSVPDPGGPNAPHVQFTVTPTVAATPRSLIYNFFSGNWSDTFFGPGKLYVFASLDNFTSSQLIATHVLGSVLPFAVSPNTVSDDIASIGVVPPGQTLSIRFVATYSGPWARPNYAPGGFQNLLGNNANVVLTMSSTAGAELEYNVSEATQGQTELYPLYRGPAQQLVQASSLKPTSLSVTSHSDQTGAGKWYWGGWSVIDPGSALAPNIQFTVTPIVPIKPGTVTYTFFSGNWSDTFFGPGKLYVYASTDGFLNSRLIATHNLEATRPFAASPNVFTDNLASVGLLSAGQRLSVRFVATYSGPWARPNYAPGGFQNISSGQSNVRFAFEYIPGRPVIASQPAPVSVEAGKGFTLSVNAIGSTPLAYQWRKNGNPLQGQVNPVLNVSSAGSADAGDYDVVVRNSLATIRSDKASVTVIEVPVDVTGSLSFSPAGIRLNRETRRFSQAITIRNVSGAMVAKPVSLIFRGLSPNATVYAASGTTVRLAPAGDPYLDLSVAATGGLLPGASTTVVVEFQNDSLKPISYNLQAVAGLGPR